MKINSKYKSFRLYRKPSQEKLPSKKQILKTIIVACAGFIFGLWLMKEIFRPTCTNNVSSSQLRIEFISYGLDNFKKDTGRYPSSSEGLNALIENPGINHWSGPYLEKGFIPNDPWGRPYYYRNPGLHGDYDLYSYGLDNAPGGKGEDRDTSNWDSN